VVELSERLDECIYPKTEEVLNASRDDEVFDAVFLVARQHRQRPDQPLRDQRGSRASGDRAPDRSQLIRKLTN
jgi:hypothetical protein